MFPFDNSSSAAISFILLPIDIKQDDIFHWKSDYNETNPDLESWVLKPYSGAVSHRSKMADMFLFTYGERHKEGISIKFCHFKIISSND